MRQGIKGFTLIELLITIAVLVIAVTMLVPAFSGLIARNRADADMAEVGRALGYARLEAIDKGVRVRVTPQSPGLWRGALIVAAMTNANSSGDPLRVVGALGGNATLAVGAGASKPDYVEFNSLGALAVPTEAVLFTYINGSEGRALRVCVNGRIVLGGDCT
jgi:type IV fimbrial biogenesis protein FimU